MSEGVADFRSAAEWRAWLARHHDGAKELVVRCWRLPFRDQGITYPEALDEALCFGWIDGKVQTIDEQRYRQRLTPRRRNSNWSEANVAKVAELRAQGRMTPAGEEAFAAHREKPAGELTYERRHEAAFDAEQEATFRRNRAAWKWFNEQTASYRAMATFWVLSAKRPETRARRLGTLIECSAGGRRVPTL